jgi:hypothetical protein
MSVPASLACRGGSGDSRDAAAAAAITWWPAGVWIWFVGAMHTVSAVPAQSASSMSIWSMSLLTRRFTHIMWRQPREGSWLTVTLGALTQTGTAGWAVFRLRMLSLILPQDVDAAEGGVSVDCDVGCHALDCSLGLQLGFGCKGPD